MINVKKSIKVGSLVEIQDLPGRMVHGWPLSEGGYCVIYVEEQPSCPQCGSTEEHKLDCSLGD